MSARLVLSVGLVWLAARSGAAAAHPVGGRAAIQASALTLRRDRVDVDFYADVPNELVRTARPGSRDQEEILAAMSTELASGLLLTVDGRVVSMRTREPSPAPRASSDHTMAFAVHLSAPLPPGPHAIELYTSNLVDTPSFYTGDVRVAPGLRVLECSLLAVREGRVVRDDTLRWTQGEAHRRLSVVLAAPRPRWWSAVASLGEGPIPARSALSLGLADALRPPALSPGLLGAGLLWAVAAGVAGRAGDRRVRVGQAGVAALGIGLALAPRAGSGAVEGLGAIAVLALVAASIWERRGRSGSDPSPVGGVAVAVAAAVSAGATHAALAATIVVLAFGVGLGIRVASEGRVGGILAVLGAVALGGRAALALWG